MNICIGNWESTAKGFSPETATDDDVEREALSQRFERPEDPCVGIHKLEEFEHAYNNDEVGDYSLDPAFYWIRFTD